MIEGHLECKSCGKTKAPEEFNRDRRTLTGKGVWCRECKKTYYDATKKTRLKFWNDRAKNQELPPNSRWHPLAAECGVKILKYGSYRGQVVFQCLSCGVKFTRALQHFFQHTRACPACKPKKRKQKIHPALAARRLLEKGIILNQNTYRTSFDLSDVACAKCGYEWQMQISRVFYGDKYSKCPCQKPQKKARKKDHKVAIAELREMGIEIIDPTKYAVRKKIMVRCLKCGSEWMDMPSRIFLRRNKCVSEVCCDTPAIRKTWTTMIKKGTAIQKGIIASPHEELRKIDKAIEEMKKHEDGLCFWERPELREKIENGEIDILQNVEDVIAQNYSQTNSEKKEMESL